MAAGGDGPEPLHLGAAEGPVEGDELVVLVFAHRAACLLSMSGPSPSTGSRGETASGRSHVRYPTATRSLATVGSAAMIRRASSRSPASSTPRRGTTMSAGSRDRSGGYALWLWLVHRQPEHVSEPHEHSPRMTAISPRSTSTPMQVQACPRTCRLRVQCPQRAVAVAYPRDAHATRSLSSALPIGSTTPRSPSPCEQHARHGSSAVDC